MLHRATELFYNYTVMDHNGIKRNVNHAPSVNSL